MLDQWPRASRVSLGSARAGGMKPESSWCARHLDDVSGEKQGERP